VANKEYIERIKLTVEHLHNCAAIHRATVPVHEVFQGKTVWKGYVEVFDISGHPKAKRAYGWSHADGRWIRRKLAVKVAIVAELKKSKS